MTTAAPAGPTPAAVELASALSTAPAAAANLVRRTAVVLSLNSDYTVDVTWATGGTVLNLPCLALPYPEVGDTVMCLGSGQSAKDYVVIGPILAPDPTTREHPGRGIITRVYNNTTTGSAFFGPSEVTFSVLTPPTAHFYSGRLYRSTVHCGLTTNNGGGSVADVWLYRAGTSVVKYEGPNLDVPLDGFGCASVLIVADYAMPDGNASVEFRTTNSANGLKFQNRHNSFHTIEDIGPDAWNAPSP